MNSVASLLAPFLCSLQPADVTRAKQLEQWKQLVVGWHQAHKQQVMSVKEWPFWENRAIARALPEEGVAQVMNHIVTTGSGEWADATRTRCRIFYRTPSEWAAKLHALAEGNAMTATLYTLYELHSGGALYGTGGLLTLLLLFCCDATQQLVSHRPTIGMTNYS